MAKRKKVRVVETGAIFNNARDCAAIVHGSAHSILDVCHGRQASHMGHKYEFVNPDSKR